MTENQEIKVAPETIAALIKIVEIELEYYPENSPAYRYDVDVIVEFYGAEFLLRYQNGPQEEGGFGLPGSTVTSDGTDALICAISEHLGLGDFGRRQPFESDEGYFMFYEGVVLATKAAAWEAWPGEEEGEDD